MIQEYLFTDNEEIKDSNDICINGIMPQIEQIEHSNCTVVKYEISSESERSAKQLSDINDKIIEKYNPTVLSNESSAYFNKTLYPLFNEFERKLRKLLYLKSALSKKSKETENIKDLERKDFGELFTMLFTDLEFVKEAKKSVREISWQFTKKELLDMLQEKAEHTLWEDLIGINSVPLLCSDYINVKKFRNDVMHAHNMNTKSFNDAKNLMKKINEQLDTEIGAIIGQKEITADKSLNNDFNETLSNSIKNTVLAIYNTPEILAFYKNMPKLADIITEFYETVDKLNSNLKINGTDYNNDNEKE